MYRIIAMMLVGLLLPSGCGGAVTAANSAQTELNNASEAVTVQENTPETAEQPTPTEDLSQAQQGVTASAAATDEGGVSADGKTQTLMEALVPEPTGDVVVIRDKLFIAQTDDIITNRKDYMNKTIRYEGIFDMYVSPVTGAKRCSVVRYGPGCCGMDGIVGFEVQWDQEYPKKNDWVEATGVLEEYEADDGYKYLRLALTSLEVLDKRGSEFVTQ